MRIEEEKQKYSNLATRVLELARESIFVKFRYFDTALAKIRAVEDWNVHGWETSLPSVTLFANRGGKANRADEVNATAKTWEEKNRHYVELRYNPAELLAQYKEEPSYVVRIFLHVILHNIFLHYYKEDVIEEYWNIATDIAVENVILSMNSGTLELKRDNEEKMILSRLSKWIPNLTAEKIYREFMVGGISNDSRKEYAKLFSFDIHPRKNTEKFDETEREKITISQKDFEQIARKLAQELKGFSEDVRGKSELLMNLREGTGVRYDYDEILRIFSCNNEEIKVNPDEFDYVYYTYGLSTYGNMPLIEPLEYTEDRKIKEFVIAVDTSASVRGDTVEDFLRRTYDILEKSVSFSEEMLVHLIQCDSGITDDLVIHSEEELRNAAKSFKVKGFGATDFRPVFEYVDELIRKREFTNLRGLIYFTDGYGIYPEKATTYDTMFVFCFPDEFRPHPPGWAITVELS